MVLNLKVLPNSTKRGSSLVLMSNFMTSSSTGLALVCLVANQNMKLPYQEFFTSFVFKIHVLKMKYYIAAAATKTTTIKHLFSSTNVLGW